MIKRTQTSFLLLGLAVILLTACGPRGADITEPDGPAPAGEGVAEGESPNTMPATTPTPAISDPLPPKVVMEAKRWLAEENGVPVEEVTLVEWEQAEWPGSCLGLGQGNESCLTVITPGWRVLLAFEGQEMEVRTDRTGETMRLATPANSGSADRPLAGTKWRFVTFGHESQKAARVEGATITLSFAAGSIEGNGGCNSYSGMYQVEGNDISFNDVTSTMMACADNQVTQQEQRYLGALNSASTFEWEDEKLVITYDEGVLIFEPISRTEPSQDAEASTGNRVHIVTATPGDPSRSSHGPSVANTSPDATVEGLTVNIVVDESVAGGVTSDIIPASEGGDNPRPEHIRVTFEEYVLTSTAQTPAIYVYPVNAYKQVNETAGQQIEALRSILVQAPLLSDSGEPLVLPMLHPAPLIQAGARYGAIEGGFGFAFLTQYGQPGTTINNRELFYTFQGMTSDGAYYVSAILPVAHPDLPAGGSQMTGNDYESYIEEMRERLRIADPNAFSPSLVALGEMIRSMSLSAETTAEE